jgi:hypothetical protein
VLLGALGAFLHYVHVINACMLTKRNLKGVSTDSLDFEENAKRGDLSLKLNVLKVKIYKGKVLKCEGD